jgi:hypothetical protein
MTGNSSAEITDTQRHYMPPTTCCRDGNKHESTRQKYPSRIGTSFNTMGEGKESGERPVNDGAKHPSCSRCGHTNHTLDKCVARTHTDGTMLHNMGRPKRWNMR